MTERMSGVRAFLVDLEGTVYEGGRLVPGAAAALTKLRSRGVPHLFVTNTTSRPRAHIARDLVAMGLPVEPERILSAPLAARAYLLEKGIRRCDFLVRPAVLEDFAGLEPVDSKPEAVVLGDMGEETTFARLNRAFRAVLEGAELVTLARNRYWKDSDGLVLDVGAFAAALEYATGRTATLAGKPSLEFFAAALASLEAAARETAVVGDDIEVEVRGAQQAGMRGVLVRTGKFRQESLAGSGIRPDAVLESIADLPGLIG